MQTHLYSEDCSILLCFSLLSMKICHYDDIRIIHNNEDLFVVEMK